jgi:hypothetical protein
MTTDTSHVLAAIDSALEDYAVSADAMRWAPARLPRLNREQKLIARRVCAETGVDGYAAMFMVLDVAAQNDDSPHWDEVSAAAGALLAEIAVPVLDQLGRAVQSMVDAFKPAFQQMAVSCQAFGQAVDRAFSVPFERIAHDLDAADRPRFHARRCATCNPQGNPGPTLGIKPSVRGRRKGSRRRRSR